MGTERAAGAVGPIRSRRTGESVSVYDTLGMAPAINAAGRLTALGGATLAPAVTDAMSEAAQSYCDVAELKRRAGRWIAERCGGEDAWVTSGAAAGVALMTAAVVAGTDPARIRPLAAADVPVILRRIREAAAAPSPA
jgi:D-glucosaminate-6-phosphate ammonia-lyase